MSSLLAVMGWLFTTMQPHAGYGCTLSVHKNSHHDLYEEVWLHHAHHNVSAQIWPHTII